MVEFNSIGELLEKSVKIFKNKVAITFDHENVSFSYFELNTETNRYANALAQNGIVKGTHVAVMLPKLSRICVLMVGFDKNWCDYCSYQQSLSE